MKTPLLAALAVLTVWIGVHEPAETMDEGVFAPPSLEGFHWEPRNDELVDGDDPEDGVEETLLSFYYRAVGYEVLVSHTTYGVIWAWAINSDYRTGETSASIVDSDCDGLFDRKYYPDEEYYVPECLE